MPPKRKRNERASVDDGAPTIRSSPYRPSDTSLGQHDSNGFADGGSRGGRGGGSRLTRRSSGRQASLNSSNSGGFGRGPNSTPNSNTLPTSTTAAPHGPASPSVAQRPPSSPSQTAPAITTGHATVAFSGPIPTNGVPAATMSYDYATVTDARVGLWAKSGRQEVVELGTKTREDEDMAELANLFQELIQSVLDGRLSPQDAGSAAKDIIGSDADRRDDDALGIYDPRALFLDTVSIFADMETDPAYPKLKELMMVTEVSTMLDRQVLDAPVLQNLGLIRDTFSRVGIRHSTNLLYRQANFNLLREETEGYSKLITELFTTSSSEPPSAEMVQATFERVKGMIGTFDLDVGRVLDVTLDVFAAVLIKQFRFFIKFLRVSSWWPRSQVKRPTDVYIGGLPKWALPESPGWMTTEEDEVILSEKRRERDALFWDRARQVQLDAYFELGGREVADSYIQSLASGPDDKDDSDTTAEMQWIQTTKTLPPPGNRVAAQLLGFKLRFYASEARDQDDILPANLLYLAALLIKVGFISITDLYPHLWPLDDKMESIRETRMKELEEKQRLNRPGGTANALMMAGALPDDTAPAPTTRPRDAGTAAKTDADAKNAANGAPADKPQKSEPVDQKVQLLTCLLTIGALPEALFILGRFTWLPEAYPDLLNLIHRLLNYSLQEVFDLSQPKVGEEKEDCGPKMLPEPDQTGASKGTVKLGVVPPKRSLRWPFPDKNDANEGNAYRFYWDEWTDNVPVCHSVDDVFTLCDTFLNISGVNIGKDGFLLTKLSSIGLMSLREDTSQHNLDRWQNLLRRLLVPALSLTSSNPSLVNAVWDLLKQFPTSVRYTIYGEWYEGQISRLPAIKAAFARTRLETLGTMKRLSLTNISSMARTLAKTAFASPGIVFKVALDQIEAYSNLIEVFVECAKYFTELGYDVLVWSLMNSLGGNNRSRTQETSILLTSKWLQALSKFSGKVFKRYAIMDASPVVQYVNSQLFNGNSTDLIILKELISSMGGVVPDVDFTDAQLKAMTGGEVLRRQTLINLFDKRFESVKSAKRLMKALVDTNIAGKLLVNIAQYRQSAIYRLPGNDAHIKYLASITDDAHQVLVQYLDLLRSNLEPEQFDELVPSVTDLIIKCGLEVSLAFMISRASLAHGMSTPKPPSQAPAGSTQATAVDVDVDVDVQMDAKITNGQSPADSTKAVDGAAADDKMAVDEAEPKETQGEAAAAVGPAAVRKSDHFLDVLQPIVDKIQDALPSDVWKTMSPEFFVMFWSLQLGDLAVPLESYESEHDRLNKLAEDVMKDRSDMSRSGMDRKDEKKKALLDAAKSIREEMHKHVERYQKTRFRLTKQSKTWFPRADESAITAADLVIEHCLLPRLVVSAGDTDYCYRLVRFLHENRVSNFRLMSLYDRFFNANRIRSMIFTCTVREAEHLGRFLKAVLADLSRWHSDKAVYEKEALGQRESNGTKTRNLLGFATATDEDGKPQAFVEHSQFRDVLYGWHKNLNTALKSCLAGMEWMHIRNAITILKAVLDSFPAVDFMANQFKTQLQVITEREGASKNSVDGEEGHRVDLSVTAQTANSELRKRKAKWVMVQAFRSNTRGDAADDKPSKSPVAAPAAPLALRANAPEFKPQPRAAGSQIRTKSISEVEDGEVKDGEKDSEKAAAAAASVTGNATSQKKEAPEPAAPAKETKELSQQTTSQARSATPTSSKPSTPRPAAAVPVSTQSSNRPEPSKATTLTSLPDRMGHSLPSRPDVPLPGRFQADRFGQVRAQERRDPPVEARPTRDARETTTTATTTTTTTAAAAAAAATRDSRDAREQQQPQQPLPQQQRESRDGRDSRDHREPARDPRDIRERDPRDSREHRTDARDPRDTRDPREHRPADSNSRPERPREYPTQGGRHGPESIPREQGRVSERDWSIKPDQQPHRIEINSQDRDRSDRGPLRDKPLPSGAGRPSRDGPSGHTPPPGVNSQSQQQGRLMNDRPDRPDRSDRPDLMNPSRAALMDTRGGPPRSPRDDAIGGDRNAGRTQSPRRNDRFPSDNGPRDSSRDDRHGRPPHHSDHRSGGPSGRDDRLDSGGGPPGGPRGDWGPDRQDRPDRDGGDRTVQDKGRDAPPYQQQPPPSTNQSSRLPLPQDHDQQRYSHQDPNYGRLNPVPNSGSGEIPLGPRGRGRGTTRGGPPPPPSQGPVNNAPPQGQTQTQTQPPPARGPEGRYPTDNNSHRQPSPDPRHPPTGPASSRPRRGQFDNGGGGGGGGSQLPPPQAPGGGIHPDRLRQFGPTGGGPPQGPGSQSYNGPSGGPAHLDRLPQSGPGSGGGGYQSGPHGQGHHGPPRPPPGHPQSQGRPNLPPLNTHDRSGMSSGSRPSPSGPNNANNNANSPAQSFEQQTPTGPASSASNNNNERMRPSAGGRRQLAAINSMLQPSSNLAGDPAGGAGRGGGGGAGGGGMSSAGPGGLRRASSRMNLPGSDAHVLAGQSPVSTPGVERQHDPMGGSRRDSANFNPGQDGSPAPRGGSMMSDANNNDRAGSGRRDRDRDRDRSDRLDRGDRGSGRPSRRSSRDRSDDRDRDRGGGSGELGGTREPRESRDGGRESRENREPREPRGDRENRDQKDHGRDYRDRRSGALGGGGGGGPPIGGPGGDGRGDSSGMRSSRSGRDSGIGGAGRELMNGTSGGGGRDSMGGGGGGRHHGPGPGMGGPGGPPPEWGGRGGPGGGGGGSFRTDDRGGPGGGGPGAGPRGEAPPSSDRGSRKRRSDEGVGGQQDRDKRQRR